MPLTGFLELFDVNKPVIGVLHGRGESDNEILHVACKEAEVYAQAGVDALLVENYFCQPQQAEKILSCVRGSFDSLRIGVNILNNDVLNFKLAQEYGCDFLQIDSVCGHLSVTDDEAFEQFIALQRETCPAKLIGGVRFKYQPFLSGRSLAEDLIIGKLRCDAIAVTGSATGEETSLAKIMDFKEILKRFPLVVAAGITPQNAQAQLTYGDACIVGSYFKENHDVKEAVDFLNVQKFMTTIKEVRAREEKVVR